MTRWKSVCGVCLFAVALAAAALLPGCSKHPDRWATVKGGPTRVLASFPPLYCFAKTIAGNDARVISLLTTVGPHEQKPDAADVFLVRKADLFLLNGLVLDDFLVKIVNSSGNSNKDLVHKIGGEAIPVPPNGKESSAGQLIRNLGEHKHNHAPGEVCLVCANADYDPHVWLGIDEAVLMVTRIRDLLQEKDPANRSGYQSRADALVAELHQLRAYGLEKLKGAKNRSVVTNHNSFRYFARSFGLEIVECIQLQPGIEADGQHMVKLKALCKEHNVRVIGVEPQFKRSSAEALQHSLREDLPDLTIIELDPIETAPADLDAGYYLRQMKANLDNLAKHLQ